MRPLGDVQRGYQCEQAMIVVGGESKLEALLIFGRLSPLSPYFSLLLQKSGEKKRKVNRTDQHKLPLSSFRCTNQFLLPVVGHKQHV